MRRRSIVGVGALALAVLLELAGGQAAAQTVTADRFRFNAGPCLLSSVDGSPDKLRIDQCPVLTTAAATDLTLQPTGDLVLGPSGADVMPDVGYTQNLGSLSRKYLTLHAAELWVETLVAQNTIATIGGRVLVAPTTTLTVDLAPATTTISVKHNNLANGDRVYLEADGKVEWLAVASSASGSGPYTYTVTRNLDGSGANQWYAGDAVLNTGTTGDGFIDLYSLSGVLSGAGPTIVGNARTGTTYNQIAARWAVGNLNGLFGYGADTYGFAAGDPSATNVTADPTNGFRIRHGTTNKMTADTSGNLSIVGDLAVGVSGVVRSSTASGLTTGDGFYMQGGASPAFRIGNPAGNRLVYEASTGILSLYGPGGGGRNRIRNSDCWVGTTGWSNFTNSGQTLQQGTSATGFSLNDGPGTCWFGFNATPANGTVSQQYLTDVTPVEPGHWYEASAYLGVLVSGNTLVQIQWLQANGTTQVSVSNGNVCTGTTTGGTELDDFCRSGVIAEAPGTAYNARLIVTTTHTGAANPVIFHVHNYFGEANEEQTALSPWAPGGFTSIGPGLIETGTIVANDIAASTITGAKIAAGTITASNIAAATITSTQIAAGTITASNIAAGTITGTQIAAGTLTATHIDTTTITALGAVTAGSFNIGSGNFSVTSGGVLTASLATFNGGTAINGGLAVVANTPAIITFDGTISLPDLAGGGSRRLCVDNSGFVFASGSC